MFVQTVRMHSASRQDERANLCECVSVHRMYMWVMIWVSALHIKNVVDYLKVLNPYEERHFFYIIFTSLFLNYSS